MKQVELKNYIVEVCSSSFEGNDYAPRLQPLVWELPLSNAATSIALAVKELEVGEFHWILLREAASSSEQLAYAPEKISSSHANAKAAWTAGYLALRARLR